MVLGCLCYGHSPCVSTPNEMEGEAKPRSLSLPHGRDRLQLAGGKEKTKKIAKLLRYCDSALVIS